MESHPPRLEFCGCGCHKLTLSEARRPSLSSHFSCVLKNKRHSVSMLVSLTSPHPVHNVCSLGSSPNKTKECVHVNPRCLRGGSQRQIRIQTTKHSNLYLP